jgi:phosphate starvation-inducible PhoH-like protein
MARSRVQASPLIIYGGLNYVGEPASVPMGGLQQRTAPRLRTEKMDVHPVLTIGERAREVRAPGLLREQLLVDRGGLLKPIEDAVAPYRFRVDATQDGIRVEGEEVAVILAATILGRLAEAAAGGEAIDHDRVSAAILAGIEYDLKHDLAFRLTGLSHPVRPMSLNQVAYMQALLSREKALIIGVGPTGTGKTHLALAAGVNQLALEHVKHLVITRPHVVMEGEIVTPEARQETEYDEQFRIFEDILIELVGYREFAQLVEHRQLEITPLGRMRGRTFNDSLIIVDEAHNMTVRKTRMAVTRIGRGSRMVIAGDPVQVDLRNGERSGLAHLCELVEGTDLATIHRFETSHIVRARIVAQLEELFARQDEGLSDGASAFAA